MTRRGAMRLLGLLALADVLVFGGIIAAEEASMWRGVEVRLPVEGYDPRDLLAGHYVRFRLVAVREAEAFGRTVAEDAAFCLEERDGRWHVSRPRAAGDDCRPFLAVRPNRVGQVHFGVDRFYVDERRRREVGVVEAGPDTYLVGVVDRSGRVHPRDLVVGGKSLGGGRP